MPDEPELPDEASEVAEEAVEDAGKPEPDAEAQSGGTSPPCNPADPNC